MIKINKYKPWSRMNSLLLQSVFSLRSTSVMKNRIWEESCCSAQLKVTIMSSCMLSFLNGMHACNALVCVCECVCVCVLPPLFYSCSLQNHEPPWCPSDTRHDSPRLQPDSRRRALPSSAPGTQEQPWASAGGGLGAGHRLVCFSHLHRDPLLLHTQNLARLQLLWTVVTALGAALRQLHTPHNTLLESRPGMPCIVLQYMLGTFPVYLSAHKSSLRPSKEALIARLVNLLMIYCLHIAPQLKSHRS